MRTPAVPAGIGDTVCDVRRGDEIKTMLQLAIAVRTAGKSEGTVPSEDELLATARDIVANAEISEGEGSSIIDARPSDTSRQQLLRALSRVGDAMDNE